MDNIQNYYYDQKLEAFNIAKRDTTTFLLISTFGNLLGIYLNLYPIPFLQNFLINHINLLILAAILSLFVPRIVYFYLFLFEIFFTYYYKIDALALSVSLMFTFAFKLILHSNEDFKYIPYEEKNFSKFLVFFKTLAAVVALIAFKLIIDNRFVLTDVNIILILFFLMGVGTNLKLDFLQGICSQGEILFATKTFYLIFVTVKHLVMIFLFY